MDVIGYKVSLYMVMIFILVALFLVVWMEISLTHQGNISRHVVQKMALSANIQGYLHRNIFINLRGNMNKAFYSLRLSIVVAMLPIIGYAQMSSTNYQLVAEPVGVSGILVESTQYYLYSTLGMPPVVLDSAESTSTNYSFHAGVDVLVVTLDPSMTPYAQMISFDIVPAIYVGGTGVMTATGGASGNAVTFTTTTPTVCMVTGSTVTALTTGTCSITANQAGNANYAAANPVEKIIKIDSSNGSQTITILTPAPASAAYQTTFTVSATAPGGMVTYSSGSSDVCTNKGATFTMIAATGTCIVQYNQSGIPFFSAAPQVTSNTTATAAGASQVNFAAGWNLAGNGSNVPIEVATVFTNTNNVTSVWKWLPIINRWAFYTPGLISRPALETYAASKGYDVLGTIGSGEGYWLNALTPFGITLPTGSPITSASFASKLPSGWSLIATGDNKTPRDFNNSLSTTPPAVAVALPILTSLWAWDSSQSEWYFYSPALDNDGTLFTYIASKGYLDFGSSTLTPTTGFWVNKP